MPCTDPHPRARRRVPHALRLAALLGFAFQFLAATLGAQITSPAAKQWERWEGTFTGSTSYGASDPIPYRDIKVRVTFRQGSQAFETYAFWRTGNTYAVRAAFPTLTSPGNLWTWTTSCPTPAPGTVNLCSTQNLGGKVGNVTVSATTSTSALYTKGMLRAVAPTATANRGYLAYANGDAFPWLGDTAWMAPIRATPAMWGQSSQPTAASYVKKLQDSGFTVVQVATPVGYMDDPPTGTALNPHQQPAPLDDSSLKPFKCPGNFPTQIPDSTCSMNDAYWTRFDDMVKAANDKGIVVLVAGLMEKVIEDNNPYPDLTATKTFGRTLAARLAGSHVIFSPAFDHSTTSSSVALDDRIRAIGAELLDATHNGALPGAISVRQLITNHSAGSDTAADLIKFQSETWLSFYLFQSGQAAQLAKTANAGNPLPEQHRLIYERSAQFPTQLPGKASINGEMIYEGAAAPCALCPGDPCSEKKCSNQATSAIYYTAESQRKNLWYSFFNGAAGGSLGVAGTFDWQGSGLASSTSQSWVAMKRMNAFFLAVGRWHELKPTTEGLYVPSPAPSAWQKIYAVQDVGRTKVAVYSPEGAVIAFQKAKVPGGTAKWFNPRVDNAVLKPAAPGTCPAGISSTSYTCFVPLTTGADWILLFLPSTPLSAALTVSPQAVTLPDGDTGSTLVSQSFDANGDEVGTPISIADPQTDASPQGARLAQGAGGGYLAVWQREDPAEGMPLRLVAQRLDSTGSPVGSLLEIGYSPTGRAVAPSVAATPDGGYAVAWSTEGEKENMVLARKVTADGILLDPSIVAVLNATDPAHPIVATDEFGNLAVAWEESVNGKTTTLYVRALDSDAQPADEAISPLETAEETLAGLSSLTYSDGVFDLQWMLVDLGGSTLGALACEYDSLGQPVGDLRDVWNLGAGAPNP